MELEYTYKEASRALGVSLARLRYALNTRREIPRRLVGQTAVVTIENARRALDDVRPLQRRRRAS